MSARSLSARVTAAGCVALAASLLVPPRAYADPVLPARPTIAQTGAVLAARQAPALTAVRSAQPQSPGTAAPELESGTFFKSKVGVAVLAAFGAGVGYALYSASNDRIKSTGR